MRMNECLTANGPGAGNQPRAQPQYRGLTLHQGALRRLFRLWDPPMENLLRQFKGTFNAFCLNHVKYSRVQMDESSMLT